MEMRPGTLTGHTLRWRPSLDQDLRKLIGVSQCARTKVTMRCRLTKSNRHSPLPPHVQWAPELCDAIRCFGRSKRCSSGRTPPGSAPSSP